jgi:hypothetical protein
METVQGGIPLTDRIDIISFEPFAQFTIQYWGRKRFQGNRVENSVTIG